MIHGTAMAPGHDGAVWILFNIQNAGSATDTFVIFGDDAVFSERVQFRVKKRGEAPSLAVAGVSIPFQLKTFPERQQVTEVSLAPLESAQILIKQVSSYSNANFIKITDKKTYERREDLSNLQYGLVLGILGLCAIVCLILLMASMEALYAALLAVTLTGAMSTFVSGGFANMLAPHGISFNSAWIMHLITALIIMSGSYLSRTLFETEQRSKVSDRGLLLVIAFAGCAFDCETASIAFSDRICASNRNFVLSV